MGAVGSTELGGNVGGVPGRIGSGFRGSAGRIFGAGLVVAGAVSALRSRSVVFLGADLVASLVDSLVASFFTVGFVSVFLESAAGIRLAQPRAMRTTASKGFMNATLQVAVLSAKEIDCSILPGTNPEECA